MQIQSQNGYEVHYFCAGRQYPIFKKTTLIKWKIKDITIHEIINSPIIHAGDRGSLRPDLDINEPISEQFFEKVLKKVKPEIIHIQELAGLPSSIIDIIQAYNIPTVMTLYDYFLLCPTLKLFD